MKSRLLCALLVSVAALSACGKGGQESPAPRAAAPTAVPTNAPQAALGALEIKGLRLGMDIRETPNALIAIMAERQLADFGFTDVLHAADGTQCVLMYTKAFLHNMEVRAKERYGEARAAGKVDEELLTACVNSDGVMSVRAGADGKVAHIAFNDVKDIFGAKDLPPAEFAKRMTADYRLPEMKPNETNTAWVAAVPDGSRVEVEAREVLGIPMVRFYLRRAGS